jgi:hypothetical protein
MRKTPRVGAMVLAAAGGAFAQAVLHTPRPDSFYWSEFYETPKGHKWGLFHRSAEPGNTNGDKAGQCEVALWKQGGGSRGVYNKASLTQTVDVRFCQWLQQR